MMHAPIPRRESAIGKVIRALRCGPMSARQCLTFAAALAAIPVIILLIGEALS